MEQSCGRAYRCKRAASDASMLVEDAVATLHRIWSNQSNTALKYRGRSTVVRYPISLSRAFRMLTSVSSFAVTVGMNHELVALEHRNVDAQHSSRCFENAQHLQKSVKGQDFQRKI
ncbi:hypothetical protein NX059_000694 [Plenodomus lindquistii]|nr:hypothetical protein NX059_000694 [Plenodomus lindquistii]